MMAVVHNSVVVAGDIAIVRVLWSSVAATLVVAIAFSSMVRFLTRSAEMRALDRRGASMVYGLFGVLALVVFGGTVVYGLILVTQKS